MYICSAIYIYSYYEVLRLYKETNKWLKLILKTFNYIPSPSHQTGIKPKILKFRKIVTAERNLVMYLAEIYNMVKYFDFSAFFSSNSMDIH